MTIDDKGQALFLYPLVHRDNAFELPPNQLGVISEGNNQLGQIVPGEGTGACHTVSLVLE